MLKGVFRMPQMLTPSQVAESMIEYVRANLKLQDRKEQDSKQTITFSGRSITEPEHQFALEVVINILYSNKALPVSFFEKRISERAGARLRKDRTYTGIVFPKSIDYKSADVKFKGPYFKQARLLRTARSDEELIDKYKRFRRYDVKELARIEWQFALPLCSSRIAYFNPIKNMIQVHDFQRFAVNEIIPDNIPLDKGYFWYYAERGYFPGWDSDSKKAKVFGDIQEGLHDRIRHIIRTKEVNSAFTLTSTKEGGAKLVPYQNQ